MAFVGKELVTQSSAQLHENDPQPWASLSYLEQDKWRGGEEPGSGSCRPVYMSIWATARQ